MAKLKGFVNRYLDVMEFMQELQKQLGANVIIGMILDDGRLTMMFNFRLIPRLAKADSYMVKFDPEDFHESDKITTKIVVDHVKAYMASDGENDKVDLDPLIKTLVTGLPN